MNTHKNKNLADKIKSSLNIKRVAGIAITTLTLSSTVPTPAQAGYFEDLALANKRAINMAEDAEVICFGILDVPHWTIGEDIHSYWERQKLSCRPNCIPRPKELGRVDSTTIPPQHIYPTDWYSE